MISFVPALTAAYVLDLIFGDPRWLPHPVRFIGFLIDRGEKWFRKVIASELIAGTLLTISLILVSYVSVYTFIKWLSGYSLMLSGITEILILYFCLSTKDLSVESRCVQKALEAKDLVQARQKLSRIVGRDTHNLDEKEIIRGTVETVAENTVDGIIAPIFFAVLGGAPLAMTYKTINTLDSMIGHRDEKYIRFGRTAAKIDTWVNWIPARISGLLFPLTALVLGFNTKKSSHVAWKQGAKNPVPNAGIPEGAMAGALGIQLGGTNFYQGQPSITPLLGEPIYALQVNHIQQAIQIMYTASFIFFIFGLGTMLLLEGFIK